MIFSIRQYYPEASNWTILSSVLTADESCMIHIIEVTARDGSHFIDAFIYKRMNGYVMEPKRLITFA